MNMGLCCCEWILVVTSRGHSRVAAGRLLSVAPSVATLRLQSTGSIVVAPGFSCSRAYGIFPDQGSNLHPLHCRQILNHWTTREVLIFVLVCLLHMHKSGGEQHAKQQKLVNTGGWRLTSYITMILGCFDFPQQTWIRFESEKACAWMDRQMDGQMDR